MKKTLALICALWILDFGAQVAYAQTNSTSAVQVHLVITDAARRDDAVLVAYQPCKGMASAKSPA